jgi:sortase A
MQEGKNSRSYRALIVLGVVLMCVALALVAREEMENRRAQQASAQILERLEEVRPQLHEADPASSEPTVVERIGDYDYMGSIVISAVGIDLPVADETSDDRLRISPCRYAGGIGTDDLIVCGEGYRSHFGRLGSVGIRDEVWFATVDGTLHRYVVSNVERDALEDIDSVLDDWDLTLFTFNQDGTCCVVRCVRATKGATRDD